MTHLFDLLDKGREHVVLVPEVSARINPTEALTASEMAEIVLWEAHLRITEEHAQRLLDKNASRTLPRDAVGIARNLALDQNVRDFEDYWEEREQEELGGPYEDY